MLSPSDRLLTQLDVALLFLGDVSMHVLEVEATQVVDSGKETTLIAELPEAAVKYERWH